MRETTSNDLAAERAAYLADRAERDAAAVLAAGQNAAERAAEWASLPLAERAAFLLTDVCPVPRSAALAADDDTEAARVRCSTAPRETYAPQDYAAAPSDWVRGPIVRRAAAGIVTERPVTRPRRGKVRVRIPVRLRAGIGECEVITTCDHGLADAIAAGDDVRTVEVWQGGERVALPAVIACAACTLAHRIATESARDVQTSGRRARPFRRVVTMATAALRDGTALLPRSRKDAAALDMVGTLDPAAALQAAYAAIGALDVARADALAFVLMPDRTIGETFAIPSVHAHNLAGTLLAGNPEGITP